MHLDRRLITIWTVSIAVLAVGFTGSLLDSHSTAFAQGLTCASFSSQREAQAFFETDGGGVGVDYFGLDPDGDGVVCTVYPYEVYPPVEELPPTEEVTETPIEPPTFPPTVPPTDEPTEMVIDAEASRPNRQPATTGPSPRPSASKRDQYNCSDFKEQNLSYQQVYDDIFVRNGGPERDPFGLDGDGDGYPCEGLRGAPPQRITAREGVYSRNGHPGSGTVTPTAGVTATTTTTPRVSGGTPGGTPIAVPAGDGVDIQPVFAVPTAPDGRITTLPNTGNGRNGDQSGAGWVAILGVTGVVLAGAVITRRRLRV